MQTIPQISHLSFPLGSRIPPAEEKALASGLGCEPFTLASITRKSSAHSSSSTPFMSQASPFSSSLRASTLMLQAGKEGRGEGGPRFRIRAMLGSYTLCYKTTDGQFVSLRTASVLLILPASACEVVLDVSVFILHDHHNYHICFYQYDSVHSLLPLSGLWTVQHRG